MLEKINYSDIIKIGVLGIFSLFLLFFSFPVKAQDVPLCVFPGESIRCQNCNPNYLLFFQQNNNNTRGKKLNNSALYINNQGYLGFYTQDPKAPFHIATSNPSISFQNNNQLFTLGIDQDNNFYIQDTQNLRLKITDNKISIGALESSQGLYQLKPTSTPPVQCNQDNIGTIYYNENDGLYCCVRSGWQLCLQANDGQGQTPPPQPSTATGDLKVNDSDGPITVYTNQSVSISWSANCTGDYSEPAVFKDNQLLFQGSSGSESDVPSDKEDIVSYSLRCRYQGDNYSKVLDLVQAKVQKSQAFCIIKANPKSITTGDATEISWSITCTGEYSKPTVFRGNTLVVSNQNIGSRTERPQKTTTYYGACQKSDGSYIKPCNVTVNVTPPSTCGNGVIDQGEVCDGSNLGGQTCQSLGYQGGTLQCSYDCKSFNTSQCDYAQGKIKVSKEEVSPGESIQIDWQIDCRGRYKNPAVYKWLKRKFWFFEQWVPTQKLAQGSSGVITDIPANKEEDVGYTASCTDTQTNDLKHLDGVLVKVRYQGSYSGDLKIRDPNTGEYIDQIIKLPADTGTIISWNNVSCTGDYKNPRIMKKQNNSETEFLRITTTSGREPDVPSEEPNQTITYILRCDLGYGDRIDKTIDIDQVSVVTTATTTTPQ